VMFMGAVGGAVTPIQIRGFSAIAGLPNLAALAARREHVGEPELFRPFEKLVTRHRLGTPAELLAHACGAGAWIMPDATGRMVLDEPGEVRTEATGRWDGKTWLVDVSCTEIATGRAVLQLTLGHRAAEDTQKVAA